jgi:hypothetical protein
MKNDGVRQLGLLFPIYGEIMFHIIQDLLLVDKFIISPIDGWIFP